MKIQIFSLICVGALISVCSAGCNIETGRVAQSTEQSPTDSSRDQASQEESRAPSKGSRKNRLADKEGKGVPPAFAVVAKTQKEVLAASASSTTPQVPAGQQPARPGQPLMQESKAPEAAPGKATWSWSYHTARGAFFLNGTPKISVEFDEVTGEVYLRSNSDSTFRGYLTDIGSWKGARDRFSRITLHPYSTQGRHEVNITELLPRAALQNYGRSNDLDGPNCFQTALHDVGLVGPFRHVSEPEWRYILANSCVERTLTADDKPQPGDIGAVRRKTPDGNFEEIHGFVGIGNLAFSKNGKSRFYPPHLQVKELMLDLYEVDLSPECREASGVPQECNVFVNYFQCDPSKKPMPEERVGRLERSLSRSEPKAISAILSEPVGALIEGMLEEFRDRELERTMLLSFQVQLEGMEFFDSYQRIRSDLSDEEFKKLIKLKDSTDYTHLMTAVRKGDAEKVRLLFDHGADPQAKDAWGFSALDYARMLGKLEIIPIKKD